MNIEKDDNPTTGYQWEVEYDQEYLDFLGKDYRSHLKPGERLLGVGGTALFTFRALKPGLTKLILKHRPPGEPRPFPVETYNVLIY
jgi:predicted secreted protein